MVAKNYMQRILSCLAAGFLVFGSTFPALPASAATAPVSVQPGNAVRQQSSTTKQPGNIRIKSLNNKQKVRPGELLVRFKPGYNPDSVLGRFKLFSKLNLKNLGVLKLKLDPTQADLIMKTLANNPAVEFIQPNHVYSTYFTPTDDLYNQQWSLQTAQLPQAWDKTQGNGVKIAIIDSGIDMGQPDLKPNFDHTSTGYVNGYNVFHNTSIYPTNDPFYESDLNPTDLNGHGTHVAGIAAAAVNGQGVVGVAPQAKIIPVKVLDKNGQGDDAGIAFGIRWAADHGAQVINMSFGSSYSPSQVLQDAIAYAYSKNVVLVAAAGNDGRGRLNYPAAMNGVISVAATNQANGLASFSTSGPGLDLAAPGTGILSTMPTYSVQLNNQGVSKNVGIMDGTSMASPFVAGTAALVLAQNPSFTPDQVEQKLKSGAVDVGPVGTDSFYGAGLVNADRALGGAIIPIPGYTGGDTNENNDDPTHGTAIPINQTTTLTGTFNPNADSDWYKFTAQTGDIIKVNLTVPSAVDGVLELYDGDFGSPIVSGNAGGNGYAEKIEYTIMGNKTMYLKVFDDNAGSGSHYTLNVTHIRPAKDQWEPNDSISTAKPVGIGNVYTGTISPAGDVDYYKFTIPSNGNVTATLTSPQNFNADIGIYDQNGYNYSFAYYKDNGAGAVDVSTVQLKKAGDYYVKVNGTGYNYSEAPYSFKLDFTPDTTPPKVVSSSPAPGSTGLEKTVPISVLFDEALDGSTVNSSSVKLLAGTSEVAGQASYLYGKNTIEFKPNSPLAQGPTFTLQIKGGAGGVTDLCGNPLASDYLLSFTTAPEAQGEYVTGSSIGKNETGVSRAAALMIKFKSPVDQASLNNTTFKLLDSSGNAADGQFSLDPANNAVMFKPNALLKGAEKYKVIITGGAAGLKSTSGEQMALDYTLEFTTCPATDSWQSINGTGTGYSTAGISVPLTKLDRTCQAISGKTTPAYFNNRIYVHEDTSPAVLSAFDATTGEKKWSYRFSDYNSSKGPAVNDDGTIYAVNDGKLFAFRDYNNDFQVLWSTALSARAFAVVISGDLVIASTDTGVYAVNKNTHQQIWHYTTSSAVNGPAALSSDKVFFAASDGVYAVDRTTGNLAWKQSINNSAAPGLTASSPILAAGKIFIGSANNSMYALNQSDGSIAWSTDTGAPISSIAAYGNNTLYFRNETGKVLALDPASGNKKWEKTTGSQYTAVPTVTPTGIALQIDSTPVILDPNTGNTIWQGPDIGERGYSRPIWVNNTLFFTNNKIIAFKPDQPIPTPAPPPFPLERKAAVNAASANVRSGPGTGYSVITSLASGTIVTVYGSEGTWSKVRLTDARTGYMATSLLKFIEDTGTLTVAQANVRSGPGTTYNIVGLAKQGENFAITGKSGTWYKVRLNSGTEGFISGSLVKVITPAPLPGPTPSPQKGTTTGSWSNVRTGPGTTYSIITSLPQGTEVIILATEGTWYKVQLANGTTGYIASSLITVK